MLYLRITLWIGLAVLAVMLILLILPILSIIGAIALVGGFIWLMGDQDDGKKPP